MSAVISLTPSSCSTSNKKNQHRFHWIGHWPKHKCQLKLHIKYGESHNSFYPSSSFSANGNYTLPLISGKVYRHVNFTHLSYSCWWYISTVPADEHYDDGLRTEKKEKAMFNMYWNSNKGICKIGHDRKQLASVIYMLLMLLLYCLRASKNAFQCHHAFNLDLSSSLLCATFMHACVNFVRSLSAKICICLSLPYT